MIYPFKGYRYSKQAGLLSNLIAPPYDVISSQYRKDLLNRSPYNIVNLTLPDSFDSDYHCEISQKLDDWCREKILVQDETENYYIVVQKFFYDGRYFERHGLIGLFDLKKSDRVITHEVIFNKYRDDRIKLLDATKSNLEPIFLLFEDREHIFEKSACLIDYGEKIDFEDTSIMFAGCKPEILSDFIDKISNGNLFIADGHHRFQASLEFFQTHPGAPGYIMVYLTNLFSDGLIVLPTHRALKTNLTENQMKKIKDFFEVENKKGLKETIESIENKEKISFGVYHNKNYQVWTVKETGKIINLLPERYSNEWKSLDVVILHQFLIEKIFGIPSKEKLYYDRDPQLIVDYVNQNPDTIGFFMQTPDLVKIKQVSTNGEILPPKATYFFPKVPSGLVIARYV